MRKLFIIHFQPIESYPPVQNIIRFLEKRNKNRSILIVSTKGKLKISPFVSASALLKIYRFGRIDPKSNSLVRLLNYFLFYLCCLWQLILKKPEAILYFETLSSFPALIYKKIFNRNVKIFIHYHEYTSPKEYQGGMFMNRKFHEMEMAIYPLAEWVSHTNQDRMNMFLQDIRPVGVANPMILSNYPPEDWKQQVPEEINKPVKIIYVGALSLETMYLKEFSEWVASMSGDMIWDIYSINIADSAINYLKELNCKNINLKAGVEYGELKTIIPQYHIGVILYKGHIPNYVFNAPNKLFEYGICGLDVWLPDVLSGSQQYTTTDSYPKIISLDFLSLDQYKLSQLVDRSTLRYDAIDFTAGKELEKLYAYLYSSGSVIKFN